MIISTVVVPNGGWSFFEPPITIKAGSFDKLVMLVTDHRLANGKPTGNPTQEIMDQIGEKNPQLNTQKPTIFSQVTEFALALKNFLQNGGALVEKEEAERRAAICLNCHNNTATIGAGTIKCGACAKGAQVGVDAIRRGVLNGRSTTLDSRLKSCQLCGCDLRLKIWFPKTYFDPDGSQSNKWPSFCWMK